MRYFFERSQWFTREELSDFQEQRLRVIVEHANRHVPYYRELFKRLSLTPADIRTVSDLAQLPSLRKDVVRSEFKRLQADDKLRYRPRLEQTSGTSGEPLRFLLDKPSNVLEFVYYWRHWSWAGYQLGARFAELSSSYFLRSPQLREQPAVFQRAVGRLLLNSLELSPARVGHYVDAIRRYRPLYLKGTPSALSYFTFFLQENGISDLSFRAVFSTGEMLLPRQRVQIEAALHTKVYDSYGHMERTVAVSECPQGGYHIVPEYGILELVEHTPGDGGTRLARIVGTSLHNWSMPLLRYEVGDVAELLDSDEPCLCGRAAPRIRRIVGRLNDVVVTPEGRVVTALFVALDDTPGILMGQFVQETRDRLRIRVVKGTGFTQATEENLRHRVQQFLGPVIRLEFEYLSQDDLRRDCPGKIRVVVSHVNTQV